MARSGRQGNIVHRRFSDNHRRFHSAGFGQYCQLGLGSWLVPCVVRLLDNSAVCDAGFKSSEIRTWCLQFSGLGSSACGSRCSMVPLQLWMALYSGCGADCVRRSSCGSSFP